MVGAVLSHCGVFDISWTYVPVRPLVEPEFWREVSLSSPARAPAHLSPTWLRTRSDNARDAMCARPLAAQNSQKPR